MVSSRELNYLMRSFKEMMPARKLNYLTGNP